MAAVTAPSGGRSLAELVQTTFAVLQQTHPAISGLYANRKLWESIPATSAASTLRDELIATVNRQRSVACSRADRQHGGQVVETLRLLLTFGARIWFPFLQPILKQFTSHTPGAPGLASIFVDMLGMSYLMNMLSFFLVYFSIIWLALRWDTQQRVARLFARWRKVKNADPPLSLNGRIIEWIGGLLEPVRGAREQMENISSRARELGERGN